MQLDAADDGGGDFLMKYELGYGCSSSMTSERGGGCSLRRLETHDCD